MLIELQGACTCGFYLYLTDWLIGYSKTIRFLQQTYSATYSHHHVHDICAQPVRRTTFMGIGAFRDQSRAQDQNN